MLVPMLVPMLVLLLGLQDVVLIWCDLLFPFSIVTQSKHLIVWLPRLLRTRFNSILQTCNFGGSALILSLYNYQILVAGVTACNESRFTSCFVSLNLSIVDAVPPTWCMTHTKKEGRAWISFLASASENNSRDLFFVSSSFVFRVLGCFDGRSSS